MDVDVDVGIGAGSEWRNFCPMLATTFGSAVIFFSAHIPWVLWLDFPESWVFSVPFVS